MALESAIDECSERVIDRGQAIKKNDSAGEKKADLQTAKAIKRMGENAANSADAANMKNLAQNYERGDRNTKDTIIKGLRSSMLAYTLVGIASTLALSCALVGVPVLVMTADGKWVDGTQITNDDGGYTLLTDTNDNGLVDTMQGFDASGSMLGATENMSTGDTIIQFLSALF